MNPETNNHPREDVAFIPAAPAPHPVHQITPLSKYLALTMFITLPFVGGYIGYRLAPERVVEVSTPIVGAVQETHEIVPAQASNTSTATTTSLKYVTSFDAVNKNWDNFEKFTAYTEIPNISLADQSLTSVLAKPFLTLVASTSDTLFLTAHCFKATECNYAKLYAFDLTNKVLREMTVSSFYNTVEYGAIQSPDKTTIVVVKETATSSLLYALNLLSDTSKQIKAFEPESGVTFCAGIGCQIEAKWKDAHTIDIVLYSRNALQQFSTTTERISF